MHLGEASEDSPNTWTPSTHLGNWDEIVLSWLCLALFNHYDHLGSKPEDERFLSLCLWFCHSNKWKLNLSKIDSACSGCYRANRKLPAGLCSSGCRGEFMPLSFSIFRGYEHPCLLNFVSTLKAWNMEQQVLPPLALPVWSCLFCFTSSFLRSYTIRPKRIISSHLILKSVD